MKFYIVLAVVLFALWWEYNNRLAKSQRRPVGVVSPRGSRIRQATTFSGSGSASPGSGVNPVQPVLATTWGITGGVGPGYTGPSYMTGR